VIAMRESRLEVDGETYVVRELTAGEDGDVLEAATEWDMRGKPRVRVGRLNLGMVAASLKEWSLKDGEGKPLPVNETSVRGLPRHVFYRLLEEVSKLNELSARERNF